MTQQFTLIRTVLIGCCFAAVLFTVGEAPSAAYATGVNYVPLAPIDVKGSELTSKEYNAAFGECRAPTCFPRYLRTVYNVGIALAGLFVVFSIVRGGFTLLFTDSILGHSEGKGIILRALGGLVIVYSSYLLMNLINPGLARDLDLALQFPRVSKTPTTTPLTVVLSDYQYALMQEARVRSAQWRAQETERIEAEIRELNDELNAAKDGYSNLSPEEVFMLNTLIAQKEADKAALIREGAIRPLMVLQQGDDTQLGPERAQKAVADSSGDIIKINDAYAKSITDAGLTGEALAQARIDQVIRTTSEIKSRAFNLIDHPPIKTTMISGVSGEAQDWNTANTQIGTLIQQIISERDKMADRFGTTDAARKAKVMNEGCYAIQQIVDQCKTKSYWGFSSYYGDGCRISIAPEQKTLCKTYGISL